MTTGIASEAGAVLKFAVTAGVIFTAVFSVFNSVLALVTGLSTLAAVSFTLFFFRDPSRHVPAGENLVLAPADGKIIDISAQRVEEFVGGECTRISIFMSLFNVHVNRVPVDGVVEYEQYHPGRFFAAFKESAARRNEMQSIGINTGRHRVLVRQIAGVVARRIRTYTGVGDRVICGSKLGMIVFGSRVDVFLPRGCRIDARPGQRTTAGVSVLGVLS
jgi:phosphatidylserine decarboxylase